MPTYSELIASINTAIKNKTGAATISKADVADNMVAIVNKIEEVAGTTVALDGVPNFEQYALADSEYVGESNKNGNSGNNQMGWQFVPAQDVTFNRIYLRIFALGSSPSPVTIIIGTVATASGGFAAGAVTQITSKTYARNEIALLNGFIDLDVDVTIQAGTRMVILSYENIGITVWNSQNGGNTRVKNLYRFSTNNWLEDSTFQTPIKLYYVDRKRDSFIKSTALPTYNKIGAFLGDSITAIEPTLNPSNWVIPASTYMGLKKAINLAAPGSRYGDYYTGSTKDTYPYLGTGFVQVNNTISNQILRLIQRTTPLGQQISWTHPKDNVTVTIDTAVGTGLGFVEETPDFIVIAAGTNDITLNGDWATIQDLTYGNINTSTIQGGARWAIETLRIVYPNAQIFISVPIQADPAKRDWAGQLSKRSALIPIAEFFGATVVDSFYQIGISKRFENNDANGRWLRDGLHPNQAGVELMARFFTSKIINNYNR